MLSSAAALTVIATSDYAGSDTDVAVLAPYDEYASTLSTPCPVSCHNLRCCRIDPSTVPF